MIGYKNNLVNRYKHIYHRICYQPNAATQPGNPTPLIKLYLLTISTHDIIKQYEEMLDHNI